MLLTTEVSGQGYHYLSNPNCKAAQIDSEDRNKDLTICHVVSTIL